MKTPILLYALLLGMTLVYPFYVEDYLYPKENLSLVSSENFSVDGIAYKLIKINKSEAFLISNNTMITNITDVENVIKVYYKGKYAPSQAEVDDAKNLLQAYNYSRNDGGRWKGKEESAFRTCLLLDGQIGSASNPLYCTNETTCTKIAQIFYNSAPFTEGVRQTIYYVDAAAALKEFAYASNELGALMTKSLNYMGNLDDNNMKEAFTYIKNAIPKIKEDEKKMESNIYRTPRLGDKKDLELCKSQNNGKGCFGLCPDISLNETALADLETRLTALLSKIGPFADYKNISLSLASNTQNRLLFRENEDKADIYISKFAPVQEKGEAAILRGDNTLIYVSDDKFKSKVDLLKELDNKINSSIAKRNFSSIDDDLLEYSALSAYVSNKSLEVFSVYNDTFNSKQKVSALVFAIQTKGELPVDLAVRFGAALNSSITLDSQFTKGLSAADYAILEEGYDNVSTEVSSILQQQKEFVAISKFRSLSRRINNGFYEVVTLSNVTAPTSLSTQAQYLPIAFSAITWLSISALAILAFIAFIAGKKIAGKLTAAMHFAALICALGAILIFSVAFYFYLDKTSNNADLEEFLISMNGEKNASVVLELQDVPSEAANSMKDCANLLKSSLSLKNMSISIYEVRNDSCKINGQSTVKTPSECAGPVNEPSFVLKYSSTASKPIFSAVFNKKSQISGDASYFNNCQISAVFS